MMLIVKINGIYDIICALFIMLNHYKILEDNIISQIHLSVYNKDDINKFNLSLLIVAWGIIRLLSDNYYLTILSYKLEILYYTYELLYGDINKSKGLFIIIASFLIIIYLLY